jgi:hypothetical protein
MGLYMQMLHPLSSLYYGFDPALHKLFYFGLLFMRVNIAYILSFALFKDNLDIEISVLGFETSFSIYFFDSFLMDYVPAWLDEKLYIAGVVSLLMGLMFV